MENYFGRLGFNMRDCVTGFQGILTTVSFDLYGCVQGWLTPVIESGNEKNEGRWFDMKRLSPISAEAVMAQPDFINVPGPESKGAPYNS